VELLAGRSGREIELCIERVEAKEIAVRLARRRTRPVVANFPEVVSPLTRAIIQLLAFRNTFRKRLRACWQVPKHPVHPGSHGRIGVVRNKREAGALGWSFAPLQSR